MNVILKASALFLTGSLIGILLRKNNPEFALLLSLATITTVFIGCTSIAGELKAFVETVQKMSQDSALTYPVWKCLAIAVITRISSELCRDASQGAASSAMEFTGTICALCVAMPLILSVAKTIGGLL